MEFQVQTGNIAEWKGDGLVVYLLQGGGLDAQGQEIDRALEGALSTILKESDFKGESGKTRLFYTLGKIPAVRVCIAGLGKQDEFTVDGVRRAAASAGKALKQSGAKSLASPIPVVGGKIDLAAAAEAVAEGLTLGLWQFRKYFNASDEDGDEEANKDIQSVFLLVPNDASVATAQSAVERGRIIAGANNLARELANEPGNAMTPTRMMEVAREVAQKYGLEFYAIDREEARRKGMGSFLGVAQGSEQPPFMIVLHYWGTSKDQPGGLGLIGKGITFDSGGISLKPPEGMEHMKGDMSGGAAVIGAMQAIAQLKPRVNVTGIVAATENMPSGKALKPGDIIRAMNGKSIEVVNTDAEGRLVLADAVAYATRELKLDTVVDAATLTGAMVVALGHVRTGVFANNDGLAQEIVALGEETGEKMWQMPMDREYREQLKSDFADIKNTGGRPGGSITGAWFIRSFVEDGARWAHLDIAGTAHTGDGKERGYQNKWGSGVPTRTFIQLALKRAAK